MFAWLKKKAAQQSLFNVEINTRTLILAANRADAAIQQTGTSDPVHTGKVVSAQKSLLSDIQLALGNGASVENVNSRIAVAKSKEHPTDGAEIAITHVLSYIENPN